MVTSSKLAALVSSAVLCALPMAAGFHGLSAGLPATRAVAGRGLFEGSLAASQQRQTCAVGPMMMSGGRRMRVAPRNAPGGSTAKRAGRLGKLVMTELVGVLRSPYLIKVAGGDVDAELASLISVVEVDMSGDNKVAKVMVSAMGSDLEKKRAVQWLNKNARAIRFSLAQRMSHMKSVPELRFIASQLPEAMEVMSILDELRKEREARELASPAAQIVGEQIVGEEEQGEEQVVRVLETTLTNDDALFASEPSMSR